MPLSRRDLLLSLGAAPEKYVRVSPRDPRYLEYSDGTPYIPIGLNLIAPAISDEVRGLAQMDEWLGLLAENGGNFCRFWLGHPFFDVEHRKSGEYDPAKAARIEKALASAARRGVRVKLCMESFRSIGGGPQAWADKPLHNAANGGPAETIADFFDSERSRMQFRQKIAWYRDRFGDRPEIFGWELWNEIDAVRGGDYLAWTAAMMPALHAAFPKNLCMQSLGSFDNEKKIETYRRHSVLAGNDLAQVHRYLDLGATWPVCRGPVDVLAAQAVRTLASFRPGRPVLLAESGAVEPRHTGPFKLYARDEDGTILHDVLFAPFFAGACGPGHIWHWDVYVAKQNLWWQFARFAEAVKGIDPPAEKFEAELLQNERLRFYWLRGVKTTLIWIRDGFDNWNDGLARRAMAGWVRDLSLELGDDKGNVRFYDPWENRWDEAGKKNYRVKLPEFKRSLVVRIDR